eukprot:6199400-Pleurochrysis_carterae.AAC.1
MNAQRASARVRRRARGARTRRVAAVLEADGRAAATLLAATLALRRLATGARSREYEGLPCVCVGERERVCVRESQREKGRDAVPCTLLDRRAAWSLNEHAEYVELRPRRGRA